MTVQLVEGTKTNKQTNGRMLPSPLSPCLAKAVLSIIIIGWQFLPLEHASSIPSPSALNVGGIEAGLLCLSF